MFWALINKHLVLFFKTLIRVYQLSFRLIIGPRCRFVPTCSDYAIEALEQHGIFQGGRLTAMRLCKCRPGGGKGFDPVPPPPFKFSED